MTLVPNHLAAAQTHQEAVAFIEAFAKVSVGLIRRRLGTPAAEVVEAEQGMHPDWEDLDLLRESGIDPARVDAETRMGRHYLHINVAASRDGARATKIFLDFTGLSMKLQKTLFPVLASRPRSDRNRLSAEVSRLNSWLDWVREDGFDPTAFITYQRGIGIHGGTQNLTGAIGATGAAIAFIDAIRSVDTDAITDHAGEMPPAGVRSPQEIFMRIFPYMQLGLLV